MHNGDNMIKAIFNEDNFTIMISVEKFKSLWDDSYSIPGEYDIKKYNDILLISSTNVDLNSFIAEQILSILNEDGEEDEGANNEYFEDYGASNCIIKSIENNNIYIIGKMISF